MVQRKAARVLPDPVGAWIRVCSPLVMAGQPSAWARVGAGKEASNQVRVAGEKLDRRSTTRRYQGLVTRSDRKRDVLPRAQFRSMFGCTGSGVVGKGP